MKLSVLIFCIITLTTYVQEWSFKMISLYQFSFISYNLKNTENEKEKSSRTYVKFQQ